MQSANTPTRPAPEQPKLCTAPTASRSWLNRRVMIVLGLAVVVGLTALGLGQNWLTVAGLLPLLYVLPCAALMFMCMKGMNHSPQAGSTPASSPAINTPQQAGTDV